jgi:predicted nucleic acid-binding protein
LIYFAKIGKLEIVLRTCRAFATEEVYREVAGSDTYPDSLVIKDSVEADILNIYKVVDVATVETLMRHPEIHRGEAETMVAARELAGSAVIDDGTARAIAELYGLRVVPGTLFLLFRLLRLGFMDAGEAERTLRALVACGLYLDARTLVRVEEKLREQSKSQPASY